MKTARYSSPFAALRLVVSTPSTPPIPADDDNATGARAEDDGAVRDALAGLFDDLDDDDDDRLFDDDEPPAAAAGDDEDQEEDAVDFVIDEDEGAVDDDELRRGVYHGLVHCIITNQALWATVDVALLPDVLSAPLSVIPGAPLSLQPLWDHMVLERGTARDDAAETLLLFQSRAHRWDIDVTLPAELEALPLDKRERAIERLRARGGGTGTHVGPAPTAPPRRRRPRPTTTTLTTTATAIPAALPTTPSWARGAVLLRAAFALTLVLGIGLFDRSADDGVDRVRAVMAPACSELRINGEVALCSLADRRPFTIALARSQAATIEPLWRGEIILLDGDDPLPDAP